MRRYYTIVFIFTLLALFSHGVNLHAQESDDITITFTEGCAGPILTEGKYFAGEVMFPFIGITKSVINADGRYEVSLYKSLAPLDEQNEDSKEDIGYFRGVAANVESPITLLNSFNIPQETKTGKYRFSVRVYDVLHDQRYMASAVVEVADPSEFAIRNVILSRSLPSTPPEACLPGARVFCVGEAARILFTFDGAKANMSNEIDVSVQLELINSQGNSFNLFIDGLQHKIKTPLLKERPGWYVHYPVQMPQSGDYAVRVTLNDNVAEKKVTRDYAIKVMSITDQPVSLNAKEPVGQEKE